MTAPVIDYEGFEDLDDHRFLWMALLHLDEFAYGWGDQEIGLLLNTQHPDFEAPEHIVRQYPDALPIVLQHQYEDLRLERDHVSVRLSFNGQTCKIVAPYDAVMAFQDARAGFSRTFGTTAASTRAPAIQDGNVVSLFPGDG